MCVVVQHLSGVLPEGGVGLQKSLHTLLKFTEFSFGGLVLKRGRGCLIGRVVLLLMLVMTIIGKVRSHGIVLAPKEVWVISPSRIVRLRVRLFCGLV